VVTAVPVINEVGIVGNANSPVTAPLAAGTIASVLGTNLNDGSGDPTSTFGSDGKLVTILGEATVTFNGIPAPLFSSFPDQLNVQVPLELSNLTSVAVQVTTPAGISAPFAIPLASFSPAIFVLTGVEPAQGVIVSASSGTLAARQDSIPGMQAQPARPGEFIAIYCTGLGPVTNTPATGQAAPSNPLATTIPTPQVTIGGIPAVVSFAGLVPGFVGLYQVNAQIPGAAPEGNAIPVILSIGGAAANPVTIAIAGS
jgi:uncharacterized protein (TIGR03437 family)